jgi:ribosomal protein S12 methylthiotransferase
MYCYPEMIDDELLYLMAKEEKILKYIDVPIQHSNEKILSAMNRCGSYDTLMQLINKMREIVPEICIRTTVMVGFPGEKEEEFEELARFVKTAKFDKLGCFAFSPEENTVAETMDEQVDDDVKQRRLEIIMQEQCFVSESVNRNKVGKVYDAVVDYYDAESGFYYARSYFDAPEIDSCIVFTSDLKLFSGMLVKLEIIGYDDYDLKGQLVTD